MPRVPRPVVLPPKGQVRNTASLPIPWVSAAQLGAFQDVRTSAHRLCTAAEGWIERFGDDALISYKEDAARDLLHSELRSWAAATGFSFRRVFGKFIPRQNADRIAPVLLEGDLSLPLDAVIEEAGIKFGVDFAAGYSSGFFIDQRANRAYVRRLGAKRLLNTFAYTCSFSIAAAFGGAGTLNLDLSKKSLDRGRENFALNGLAGSGHQFLADDVLDLLPRLGRRGEQFDCIILDPPTFSRGNKGRRFQVERDFEALLATALEIAAPRARILLSTNCTRLTGRALEQIARYCLRLTRRSATFHQEPPLPDIPPEAGAQTLWMVLGG